MLLILLGSASLYLSGLAEWASLRLLVVESADLRSAVSAHPIEAAAIEVAAVAAFLLFSLPGGDVPVIAGGLLFDISMGSLLSIVGALVAALLAFLAVRHVLPEAGEMLHARSAGHVGRRLADDGATTFLAFRLLPMLPFSLIQRLLCTGRHAARHLHGGDRP
ncbi:MAG: VTT domain-containing protein [Rhodospirillales bacterium]|nr:VTT domain-containing protein [Acetobacter sp.]